MKRKQHVTEYGKINNVNTLRNLRMDPKYQEEQDLWLAEQDPRKKQELTKVETMTLVQLERSLPDLPLNNRLRILADWGSNWLTKQQQQHVTIVTDDVTLLFQLLASTGEDVSEKEAEQRIALLTAILRRMTR